MGLFSKKTIKDELIKYLIEQNISIEGENPYSFQLNLNNYSLFPYITIKDNNFSFMINIRRVDNINLQVLNNINNFNLKSKYLTCKINNDNVIVLEYNSLVNTDNVKIILENIIESVFNLNNLIDLL